ncbi:MAG: hypothetical protein ACRDRV_02920 [Pseudonocardiaceae bacterium]
MTSAGGETHRSPQRDPGTKEVAACSSAVLIELSHNPAPPLHYFPAGGPGDGPDA